jgi:hypothetical protein
MRAMRAAGALIAVATMMIALATPAAAGIPACALQATVFGGSATEVNVSEEVLIEGFDFLPGDVEISYSVDGAPLSTVTVTADGSGAFETTVTPQAGEEGLWGVEATNADDSCTATTGFLVLGLAPTPTPTPTPAATPTATPVTDELPDVATAPPVGIAPPWLLGAVILATSAIWLVRCALLRRAA